MNDDDVPPWVYEDPPEGPLDALAFAVATPLLATGYMMFYLTARTGEWLRDRLIPVVG